VNAGTVPQLAPFIRSPIRYCLRSPHWRRFCLQPSC
jgi:hypothetical protein